MRERQLRRILQTMEVGMKKLILIVVLGLTLGSAAAFAHDYGSDVTYGYYYQRPGRLAYEINHVNRMLAHVRWELRHYGGGWYLRREVARLSVAVDRVNWRYNHGAYDRYYLHREVERIHAELHNIETRLHVRPYEFYRWD